MRWILLEDFCGPRGVYYETGTVIDGNSPEWVGVPMPLCAKALDVEGANALVGWHPHNQHLLHLGGFKPTRRINV